MVWKEIGEREESVCTDFLFFPDDQKEDVVVKLVLFVGLYCGRGDTDY